MGTVTVHETTADTLALAARRRTRLGLALAAVYVIWGSTYYAMRVALEGFGPFTMGAVRFLLAGGAMYAVLRARGAPAPSRAEWWASLRIGVLMLALGNGFVAVGEQRVDSGLAAVVVATMPLWAAMFAFMWGHRPSGGEVLGMLTGFAGVVVLHLGGTLAGGVYAAVLLLAPVCWALGSVLSRRLQLPRGPMASATQMLGGGVSMAALALARHEHAPHLALRPVSALAYLVVFGSLVGFSAYSYLLRETRAAVATSYAYVNPVIAVVLGAVFGGERVGRGTVLGMVIILAGVVVLSLAPRRRA